MKQVTVRSGKGQKNRMTTLSASLSPLLENHLRMVKTMHDRDLAEGHGAVYLPYALVSRRAMLGLATGWSRIRFRSVYRRHHA